MGWKTINGRSYYYSCERVRGRVVTTYRGAGEFAGLVAKLESYDALRRGIAREEAKASYEAERANVRQEDAEVAQLDATLARLADAEMEDAGFHRIKRGPWRRRRTMGEAILAKRRRTPLPDLDAADLMRRFKVGEPAAVKRYGEIIKTARGGDPKAGDEFRELYRVDPEAFRATTDSIVLAARDAIVDAILPKEDHIGRITLDEWLEKMARDLEGPNPSPVERILAGRATLCWLDAYRCDYEAIKTHNLGESVRIIGMRICRQDRAHRRLLSALKMLAEIRNLPLFRLQVSIQPPPPMRAQTALEV